MSMAGPEVELSDKTPVAKLRNVNDDLIRLLAMGFVFLMHAPSKPWENQPMTRYPLLCSAFVTLLNVCNGLFFILSGKMNLNREFHCKADYITFYKKRFVSLLLPYMLLSALLSLWNMLLDQVPITPLSYLAYAFRHFMGEDVYGHLWFLYALVGMTVSTPFLSKLLHALSDTELRILLAATLLWGFIRVNVMSFLDLKFWYGGWFLPECLGLYVAGYLIGRLVTDENRWKWYLMGLAGCIASWLFSPPTGDRYGSASYLLYSVACFVFLERTLHVKSRWLSKTVAWLSQSFYAVYIIHGYVYLRIASLFVKSTNVLRAYLKYLAITVPLTFAIAAVLTFALIKPLQKGARRLLKLDANR